MARDEPSRDPLTNAIFDGMCRDIRLCLEHKMYRAAIVLLFTSIDSLAHLGRPVKKNGDRSEFLKWVSKYMRFSQLQQPTPEEWWEARNASVHTYGAFSRKTRHDETLRVVGWMIGASPPILANEASTTRLVLVDLPTCVDVFLEGTQRFVIELFQEAEHREVYEQRLGELTMLFKRDPEVAKYIEKDWVE